MNREEDKNYVSIGFWMLAMFLMAIPCVGWIMIIIWAFAGENESRKNYFRAMLIWFLIFVGLVVCLMLLGMWPEIQKQIRGLMQKG